jgi:carbonic anhydrase
MRKGWMTFALLALAVVLVPAGPRAQWKTRWSYEGATGAEHWGELDPEYATCKTGKAQSPIDIQSTRKVQLPVIRFEYTSGPLKYLINNGYTIRVNYHDAPGTGNFLTIGDKRYQLTQFHFHRPSEEFIHGKPYEMEIHLMHQASDGQIAGVVVLLKAGSANAMVQQLWEPYAKDGGQRARGRRSRGESRPPTASRSRLLLIHGVDHRSAVHRRRRVGCAEGSVDDIGRADQRVRPAVSARCPASSAAQRTRRRRESVT